MPDFTENDSSSPLLLERRKSFSAVEIFRMKPDGRIFPTKKIILKKLHSGTGNRGRRCLANALFQATYTPWKKILLSPAVMAVGIAQFGANWLQYTLVTELPSYLGTVLHFNIKDVRCGTNVVNLRPQQRISCLRLNLS